MLALLAARVARGGGTAIAESAGPSYSMLSAWSVIRSAGAGSAATAAAAATAATRSVPPSSPFAVAAAAAARSCSSSADATAAATAPETAAATPTPGTATTAANDFQWPAHLPAHLDTPAAREELARRDAERRAALERRAARPGQQYREELARFGRARAAWRREMAGLRSQWLAEHRAAATVRAARAEAARAEAARLRAARDAAEREGRHGAALSRELRAAERAVAASEQRLASAQRDAIRGNVLAHYRAQRREAVLEASRSWVPPEELAARVRAALERPARL